MKQVRKPNKITKKLEFSKELQDVLMYMNNSLITQFPVKLVPIEYIILSILEYTNCHAQLILSTCISEDALKTLKSIFLEAVEKSSDSKGMISSISSSIVTLGQDSSTLIGLANDEALMCGAEDLCTEHILLAILNPKNLQTYRGVFNEFKLEYEELFKQCVQEEDDDDGYIIGQPEKEYIHDIPPKTGVDSKVVSVTHEYIDKYTINLNKEIKEKYKGEIIPRDKEIDEIITILARKKKNNCIIVGDGGCGKTSLVYGFVDRLLSKVIPSFLRDKIVLKLDVMALISGTSLRGMLEERLDGLSKELKGTDKYILFVDDIQQIIGTSGSEENNANMSNMLTELLESDGVRVLGTTNFKTYKKHIESNPSMNRKFQKIIIEQTSLEDTTKMLKNLRETYEKHHNVSYSDEIIEKCVILSKRYITNRCLPDSAFDVIDMVGAKTCLRNKEPEELITLRKKLDELTKKKESEVNKGNFEIVDSLTEEENKLKIEISNIKRETSQKDKFAVTLEDIHKCISDITGVPIKDMDLNEKAKMRDIDDLLKETVIGQEEAIKDVAKVIKRNSIGLGDKNRVLGTFLFCGSTGVGKSLLAKQLALKIFGDENSLVRIDMSEYSEKSSISKLIGTSSGYIGFDNGGILTEAVKRKPYCVLLLDEVEKANEEVFNLFLQLFDEGRLTDGSGQLVNFKNTFVIMTSNVGVKKANELGGGIGFSVNKDQNRKGIIDKTIKQTFAPEFLNRIDKIIYFNALSDNDYKQIIKLECNKLDRRLNELDFSMEYNDDVIDALFKKMPQDKSYGARPVIRLIQDEIEDKITDLILSSSFDKGYKFKVRVENDTINVE